MKTKTTSTSKAGILFRSILLTFAFYLLTFNFLLPAFASARNGAEPLNHYALTSLADSATGNRLAARFKSRGQPVFLIHDPSRGLAQGDIMRFQDRAVLVDADVWSTLQTEGALAVLKASSVVRVQAKAAIPTWESRSKLVESPHEKRAYLVGAELLKILDRNFGGIPSGQQVSLAFDGANLILLAPAELLDQLRYDNVRKVTATGAPRFVTPPPPRLFLGKPFSWQAWAADPAEPSANLKYTLSGELPKGLAWESATHTLKGTPESEGRFPLSAEARNPDGGFDTLTFALQVKRNEPPGLARPPRTVAVAAQLWEYRAEAADPDHEGGSIRITPLHMPQGMEFDSTARSFRWNPSADLTGGSEEFALKLEDPEGAVQEARYTLQVIPASDVLWSEGIKLDLPWDTLQQGKEYRWQAGASALAWAQQGITLLSVTGQDTTEFVDGSLRIRPSASGEHILDFAFDMGGKPHDQQVVLPVRPDLPPRFASELGTWRIRTGQHASYRPVAVDDEGDPVRMAAEIHPGDPLRWEDDRLILETREAGTYGARLLAADPAGHLSEQWVAFKVEKAERGTAWFLENRIQGGISTWTLSADLGTGRIGIFSPAIERVGRTPPGRIAREWPYLFFGGNLLGTAHENRGRRLWSDVGLTLRFPDHKVLTGGFYLRLLGEWTFPGSPLGRVELETVGHVNQALVVTDTSGLHVKFGDAIVEFAERMDRVVKEVIRAGTARDNTVLFTRLEGWSRLGYGFWAGPGIWREDMPNLHRYEQRIGAGLRYQARFSDAMAVNTLRVGWGAAGVGWTAYWSGRVSLNSPF